MHHALEKNESGQHSNDIRFRQRAIELTPLEHDSVQPITSLFSKKASEIVYWSKTDALELEANNKTQSILSGMAPFILVAQCFSLLGVSNAARRHGRSPVFRWRSPRMLFSTIVSFLIAMHAILAATYFVFLPGTARDLTHTSFIAFYMSSFFMSCLFMRLASRWTSLCAAFEDVEKRVSFYGNSSGVIRKMKMITATYLLSALAERTLIGVRNHSKIIKSNIFSDGGMGLQDWLLKYYNMKFPYMAAHIPFSPIHVIGAILTNFIAALTYTHNDLFIMLISMAISSQFGILNNSLMTSVQEVKDPRSWRHLRETYNALCVLVRTIDNCISCNVLISFVNNFFFICLQMLHTVRQDATSVYENIVLIFSAVLILSRMVGVSIFAASIYEESRAIKRMLYSVSSEVYCVEVKRLLDQANYDEVSLTGCNFFTVTRSLLLAVLGTIATYEVVLFQFNEVNTRFSEGF